MEETDQQGSERSSQQASASKQDNQEPELDRSQTGTAPQLPLTEIEDEEAAEDQVNEKRESDLNP
jgi:hypothetical protein